MTNTHQATDLKSVFTEMQKIQLADKLHAAKSWQERLVILLKETGERMKDAPHLAVKIDHERMESISFIARQGLSRQTASVTSLSENLEAMVTRGFVESVVDMFNSAFRGGSALEKKQAARLSGIEAKIERGCESRFLKLVEKFDIQPPPEVRRAGLAA